MKTVYRHALCGVLAVGMTALFAPAWTAPGLAQDKKAPAWAQGRPADLENSPLAPHAGKMTATALEDVPLDHLRLPPGFKAEVWAHGIPGARMMAVGDNGTVFFGTRGIGRVYAVTDKGGSREHKVIAEGLTQPNGVAFKDGSLYVIAINKVLRFDDIEDNLDNPESVELTDKFNLPPDVHHGWKFLAFGPEDGKLYMQVGAPCNGCEVDKDTHAVILRFNPDGSGREVVARGVRNSVGFDFHPETGELWFTDNNQDWLSEHGPHCELNRVSEIGENFGFPTCHAHGIVDPELGKPDSCEGVTLPAALMGAHSAPLGMRFYSGDMFPAEYRNAMFIARRGSWNRTTNIGFDVLVAQVSADGTRAAPSPFLTGLLNTRSNEFSGRPVDVQQMEDGSLLVSDEQNGAVYRITYEKPS